MINPQTLLICCLQRHKQVLAPLGCMINGKAFIPSGIGLGGPILDCVYQLVDGEYYFALKAKGKKNNELKTVGILTEQMEIEENKSYILTQKKENNASGAYWYSPKYIYILLKIIMAY